MKRLVFKEASTETCSENVISILVRELQGGLWGTWKYSVNKEGQKQ